LKFADFNGGENDDSWFERKSLTRLVQLEMGWSNRQIIHLTSRLVADQADSQSN
jgi:hypothetical protein